MLLDRVLEKFSGRIKKGENSYMVLCPLHDDKNPSLSITLGRNGTPVLHCHGCKVGGDTVLNSVGLALKDFYPNDEREQKSRIIAEYDYLDETGNLKFQTIRLKPTPKDGKPFVCRKPNGDHRIWKRPKDNLIPYRLPDLLAADKAFHVFIVEGEKDVDNLRLIGVTATCNPFGAGNWKDEYSEFLKGRRCVILPDNDEAGTKHAEAVAKSLSRTATEVSVLRLPDLPDKGDVSDWIAKGNTSEDLYALISGADTVEPEISSAETPTTANSGKNTDAGGIIGDDAESRANADRLSAEMPIPAGTNDKADSESELPKNYFLNERGIHYRGINKEGEKTTTFVCSPLRITAKTCDSDNESWGRRLQFKDAQGVKHDLVIPMSLLSGDGLELRRMLMDCGLVIDPTSDARQKFLRFVLHSEPKKHVRCVNQTGWHDGAFVLPDEVISANGNRDSILLQNIDRTANKFRTVGTLADWQENIARYCVGNSRLMFAVSAAFAAALLPIAEETGGGFHLHGTSSTGKTTALLVAGSVWGGRSTKGFLDTWKATGNGLESVAELHNNSLLLLDEINEVNAYEVGEIVYALSNGFGKSRMNKNTTARRKAEWNLLFFSSGEETLEQKMQSVGQHTRGGQQARFVNIEADAGKELGLYENLHGYDSASSFADHLSMVSRKFYGTAIRDFLRAVCTNRKLVESRIKVSRQLFHSKLRLQGEKSKETDVSGEVFRVASRFSLVTVAGMLASEFGVTTWKGSDVLDCGETMFEEWKTLRGTTGSYDIAQGVKQVLSFIGQHGSSRFQSFEIKIDARGNEVVERVQNRAGFKREVYNKKTKTTDTEYLVLPDVFEREICKGFSPITIAKELEKLGRLRRSESEKKYIQSKETLPELGRRRVYVVVFEADKGEANEENVTE